jgi:signal transduction histidine kinase
MGEVMATSTLKMDRYQISKSRARLNGEREFSRKSGRSLKTPAAAPRTEASRTPIEYAEKNSNLQRDLQSGEANRKDEAILITDIAGRITMANCAALNILRPTEVFMRGTTCNVLLGEGADCPHKTVSKEHPLVEHEILSRAGDRLLNIRVTSFEDANERMCGFKHVIRVVKERALESHLIEVERMSLAGLMVSSVAHEVATPLSVIINIAEMLLQNPERDSSTAVELEKIVGQTRRVAEMMRGMLDFVRQKPVEFTAVDMKELARETLDLIEYEIRKARIKVSVESNPDTPRIWGDRAQLQQVLLNLINNAIQAMKNSGFLVLRIAEDSSSTNHVRTVLLTAEDTGPGISAKTIERMFDFFFTTKTAEGGTGLGLAISRQIIEGHGGTIAAENIESGGARLSVRLPAAIACAASVPN